MTDAPKRIVASVDWEVINNVRMKTGFVTVGLKGVPSPFEPAPYIRADLHDELRKAADELAAVVASTGYREDQYGRVTLIDRDGMKRILAASAAYKQTKEKLK